MADLSRHLYRFGPFELDVHACELRKHGVRLHLRDQAFRLLLLLLERRGEIVLRAEIRDRLWPNQTIVEFDHGINSAIRRLREVLGESADSPRYIETVARRSYRFVGQVEVVEPSASAPPGRATPEGDPEDLEGKSVAHYLVLDKLGSGGMGVVFRAKDLKLQRNVALKFLPEEYSNRPQPLARFEHEARLAAALNHPNICTIYEIGEHRSRPYIAMELLEGQTLKDLLAERPLHLEELRALALQIAGALEAAHASGIIHRDIKPANLFVTRHASGRPGQAKVLDFGLAKLLSESPLAPAREIGVEQVPADSASRQTAPTSPAGTVAYMSPEQVRGEELDARTDLFSFGVVLYEMAGGKPAFGGTSSAETMNAILRDDPPALPDSVPPALDRIVRRCLQKERERRFQTATDLAAALQALPVSPVRTDPHRRKASWKWAALPAACIALLAAGWFYRSRQRPPLSGADTIVLADFANSTGEAVFDDTLKQALAAEFQQSPFWNILPERKVGSTLKLMGRSVDARLDAKTALDLCQRVGSKAVLAGSIARIGGEYTIGIDAINCQNGGSLAMETVQVTSKEQVLVAMDRSARKLRQRLGESLGSVQRFDTSLEQATTPSLDALQAYSRGRKALLQNGDSASAASLFQQAIRIDPNFAMAYLSLGLSYLSMPDSRFAENVRKAYQLRERVSEWERLAIESRYYNSVTGDLLKARQTTQLWAQTYPRDPVPVGVLGEIDFKLGQWDNALAERREAVRLDPESRGSYVSLVAAYCAFNRLGEARAVAAQALEKKLGSPLLHVDLYMIGFLEEDTQAMEQQAAWFSHTPGMEQYLLALEADRAAYVGRLNAARSLSSQLMRSFGSGDNETAAITETEIALREGLFGNAAEARRHASAAVRRSTSRDVEYAAALALAFAGDAGSAGALAGDLAKRFPEDTMVRFVFLPTIQARLAAPSAAVEILRAATPYELGDCQPASVPLDLYPVYVRGQAYLAAHRGPEAAVEFNKIMEHRGLVYNSPIGALAYVGLARAYALQGDTTRSRSAYENFLKLWKDADPGIPVLKQATADFRGAGPRPARGPLAPPPITNPVIPPSP